MENLILNETPVRTSNNFKINNVQLEDIEIPKKIKKFEKIDIIKGNSIQIDENLENIKLTYGNGKVLEENVYENANNKMNITINKKEDLNIIYNFDDNNLELINNIQITANSNSNIVIKYQSNTNKKCFHNGIIKLNTKPNTHVNVTIINLLNNESQNFESIENTLQDNSKVNYTIIDLGAKNSISNYYSNIIGKKAINDLKTIYLGIENQLKDINYITQLRGEKSLVNIDVQGVLNDFAKKNFKGTIDFKKGSKKSKGNENEYCMLLSEKAKSIALPMLLCTEEDVEGNHSTSSGKVDKQKLFYILSRGIEYKEAIKLMIKSRFNKILERIEKEEFKNEILLEIDRRLDK